MTQLDPSDLKAARAHLLPDSADALIRFMAQLSLGADPGHAHAEIVSQARRLNWIDPESGSRTTLGVLVSDSCREYVFWKERGEALPFEDALPYLARTTFEDKYVVEIGSGMGANLMSLAGTAGRICGVEPVDAYLQLGRIFREREDIADIETCVGAAEDLPFEDEELDLVLCVSAHQYFDIDRALLEFARVLRPGGEAIILGATLGHFALYFGRNVLLSAGRRGKEYGMTLVNTVGYQALKRRVLPSRSAYSTSRPVYPSAGFMVRRLRRAGFETVEPPRRAAGECCFYARRRED